MAHAHLQARASPVNGRIIDYREKPQKVYGKGRPCVVCGVVLSVYNRGKLCFLHRPLKLVGVRGQERAG